MSNTAEQLSDHYSRIRTNPRFIAMSTARTRTSWLLSALVLCAYFLFMVLAACFPQVLHAPLYPGSHLTLGIPLGASIILISWLLTGWYVHRANSHFDHLSEQIIKECRP